MLFFNRQNNDDLILAIQAAGMSRGRNGFFASKAPKAMTEKTKAARNMPRAKKTCSNTAPTAQTRLIRSTSERKNFRTTILSRCLCREFSDSVMRISPYNRATSLEVQRSIHCPFLAVPERDNFPFLFNSAITRSILLLD